MGDCLLCRGRCQEGVTLPPNGVVPDPLLAEIERGKVSTALRKLLVLPRSFQDLLEVTTTCQPCTKRLLVVSNILTELEYLQGKAAMAKIIIERELRLSFQQQSKEATSGGSTTSSNDIEGLRKQICDLISGCCDPELDFEVFKEPEDRDKTPRGPDFIEEALHQDFGQHILDYTIAPTDAVAAVYDPPGIIDYGSGDPYDYWPNGMADHPSTSTAFLGVPYPNTMDKNNNRKQVVQIEKGLNKLLNHPSTSGATAAAGSSIQVQKKVSPTAQFKPKTDAERKEELKNSKMPRVLLTRVPMTKGKKTVSITRSIKIRDYTFKEENRVDLNKIARKRGQLTCEYCFKVLGSKQTLQSHYNAHFGLKPFKCDQCKKGFTSKMGLHQHVKTAHLGQGSKCRYCQGMFPNSHKLSAHQLTCVSLTQLMDKTKSTITNNSRPTTPSSLSLTTKPPLDSNSSGGLEIIDISDSSPEAPEVDMDVDVPHSLEDIIQQDPFGAI